MRNCHPLLVSLLSGSVTQRASMPPACTHLVAYRGDMRRRLLPLRRYPEPGLVQNAHVSGREVTFNGLLDLREESQPIGLGQ